MKTRRPGGQYASTAVAGWLVLPATLLLVGYFLVPLLVLFRDSFDKFSPTAILVAALTLDNYRRFLANPFYVGILVRTLSMALFIACASIVLGFPVARFLSRLATRYKGALVTLLVLPLMVGEVIRATGWVAVLGYGGLLNYVLLHLQIIKKPILFMGTDAGVVIGMLAAVLPYMILTLESTLEGIGSRVEEAAANLGASPLKTLWTVVLPLAVPGVMAGAFLVFVLTISAYATPVLLGSGKVILMTPEVYTEITQAGDWPFGAAMGFLLMVVAIGITALSTWLLGQRYLRGRI